MVGILLGTAVQPAVADASTVTYRGVSVEVPASWPVIRLEGGTGCVRFDRHAVYLGDPVTSDCPSEVVGHVEAVHLTQGSVSDARSPKAHTGSGRTVTGGTAIHPDRVVSSSDSPVQVVVTSGTQDGLARDIADSVRFASPARQSLRGSATGPRTLRSGTAAGATSRPAAKAAARAGSATFTGLGFDACTAPSVDAMRAWLASPYRAVNIYVGGASRGCSQLALDASWVSAVVGMGWTLIPTYVGLQAPCASKYPNRITASQAAAQGRSSADDAVAIMQSLGLGAGSPVYFDMEAYDYTDESCVSAVQTFLDAWTVQLHARNFLSGIYTSSNTMKATLVDRQGDASFHQPDDIWFARWNGSTATTGDPAIPDQYWSSNQRIHQYRGGHTETWGDVTINIDNDSVDGDTAPGAPLAEGTFVRAAGAGDIYRIAGGAPLKVHSWDSFGGPQPVVDVSRTRFALLPRYPADGTFLQASSTGQVFRVLGGVATFVSSWDTFGGPQPTTVVDTKALDYAGVGGVWNHLVSSKPQVTMTTPQPPFANSAKVAVRWVGAVSSSKIRSYDVRYRRARWNGTFGSYTYLKPWQTTSRTGVTKSLPRGYNYCLSVRARNYAGDTTGWTPARCVARALDDRSLSASSGWKRKSRRGFYDGTYTTTKKYGSRLTLRSARIDRVGLVATTCRNCGRVKVIVKGKRVGAIKLYSPTTRRQQLLVLPRFSRRHGDVVLKVTSPSGKLVQIDGINLSRT
jgi:hypothetical protein